MADRILIDPDNRLLGSFSGDFAMFGGQVDPIIAARFSEAAEGQDSARESLPVAPSGTPGSTPGPGAASAETAPPLAGTDSPSIASVLSGASAPPAPRPTTTAEQADANAFASGAAAPDGQEPGPDALATDKGVAADPAGEAAERTAAAEPEAPHLAGTVDQGRVETGDPVPASPAVVTSAPPVSEARISASEPPTSAILPGDLETPTIQPNLGGVPSSVDGSASLVTTILPELTPSLAGLDVAGAPDALGGQSAALTALVDPLMSSLPAGTSLSELVTVPAPQAFPLAGPLEIPGASLDNLAWASPLPSLLPTAEIAAATVAAPAPLSIAEIAPATIAAPAPPPTAEIAPATIAAPALPPIADIAPAAIPAPAPPPAPAEVIGAATETAATAPVPLPQPPVVETASAAAAPASSLAEPVTAPEPAPAPPEAEDDLSDLGGSDPAGGVTTLVGMVSSGQILDAPEAGEDAVAPSAPADPLLDELTKGAADGEEVDMKIVTAPDPALDDADLPGGL